MNTATTSEHERTQPASSFKLSEARRKGQVAKSLDVNSWVMLAALCVLLGYFTAAAWRKLAAYSAETFATLGSLLQPESVLPVIAKTMAVYGAVLMTPLCVGVGAAILANLIQTGPIFSTESLGFKFERLNPVQGFKRIFNKRMVFDLIKSSLKLLVLLWVGYGVFAAHWHELAVVANESVHAQLLWLGQVGLALLLRLLLALWVLALLDLLFVRHQFARQMRMSHRDIKEETKRREGDPLIRAKLRQLQRETLKQSRQLQRLHEADVLVTNPTHVAVALRYVRADMAAPVVIAKGCEHWATQLRTLAVQHGIPIVERRTLARTLFHKGMVDQPIPVSTFVAVARLYAELRPQHVHEETDRVEVQG